MVNKWVLIVNTYLIPGAVPEYKKEDIHTQLYGIIFLYISEKLHLYCYLLLLRVTLTGFVDLNNKTVFILFPNAARLRFYVVKYQLVRSHDNQYFPLQTVSLAKFSKLSNFFQSRPRKISEQSLLNIMIKATSCY